MIEMLWKFEKEAITALILYNAMKPNEKSNLMKNNALAMQIDIEK